MDKLPECMTEMGNTIIGEKQREGRRSMEEIVAFFTTRRPRVFMRVQELARRNLELEQGGYEMIARSLEKKYGKEEKPLESVYLTDICIELETIEAQFDYYKNHYVYPRLNSK